MKTAAELCKEYEDKDWNRFWTLIYEGTFPSYTFPSGLKHLPTVTFKHSKVYSLRYECPSFSEWTIINNEEFLNKLKNLGYKVEKYDEKREYEAERSVEIIAQIERTRSTGHLWWKKTTTIRENVPCKGIEKYKKEGIINCIRISACCGDKV